MKCILTFRDNVQLKGLDYNLKIGGTTKSVVNCFFKHHKTLGIEQNLQFVQVLLFSKYS